MASPQAQIEDNLWQALEGVATGVAASAAGPSSRGGRRLAQTSSLQVQLLNDISDMSSSILKLQVLDVQQGIANQVRVRAWLGGFGFCQKSSFRFYLIISDFLPAPAFTPEDADTSLSTLLCPACRVTSACLRTTAPASCRLRQPAMPHRMPWQPRCSMC